ncbi:MAG: hypothetical protein U0Q16_28165 [Bryobacteraceae bacterium]
MNAKSWLLRNAALPLGDALFRHGMMSRLKFLEKAQWWSPEEIARHRAHSLASLARTAYDEVPFYHELMDSAGVKPEDIRRPEDLRRLPAVTKNMIRDNYPKRMVRNTGLKTYEAKTSGSTGKNFAVLEDSDTAGRYRAAFMLSLEWAGYRIGDEHVQNGMSSRNLIRRAKDWALACHYISAFDTSDRHLDETLDLLESRKIKHLWGYPAGIYLLSRRAKQRGWNMPLRSVVTWGDNLYAIYRQGIEEVFRTRVTDTYGCGEGIQVAAQCGEGSHYHVHAIDVIVEYVDDVGAPVPAGQTGHILLTRLHPGPMPLIRYSVGDNGSRSTLPKCPCGRHWELLESIQGRDTDVVMTPDGNRLIVHFFTGILEYFDEIDSFQVVQKQLDSMHVRIVMARGHEFTQDLEKRIVRALVDKGARGMRIHIEPVADIPLTAAGKRRFVMSEVALR